MESYRRNLIDSIHRSGLTDVCLIDGKWHMKRAAGYWSSSPWYPAIRDSYCSHSMVCFHSVLWAVPTVRSHALVFSFLSVFVDSSIQVLTLRSKNQLKCSGRRRLPSGSKSFGGGALVGFMPGDWTQRTCDFSGWWTVPPCWHIAVYKKKLL